jgi:hypothetical protein
MGEYCRTRTTSQFKWLLHAFAAAGRGWIREHVCSAGREWVEEALNLLFVQRAFSTTPEEGEEYRLTREALLRLSGPFPIREAQAEVEDTHTVTSEEFPWCPREDGVVNFRLIPAFQIPTVARTLASLDYEAQAFTDTGRNTPERLQSMTRENCSRLKAFLQAPNQRPAVLAWIGA